MNLNTLLYKLSFNKQIRVKCFYFDGQCTITLTDWYNSTVLLEETLWIKTKIDTTKFNSYINYVVS